MDSSALVKAFVSEPWSDVVLDLLQTATRPCTARLSYVECRSAMARARREGRLSAREEDRAIGAFDDAWPGLTVVELDDGLARAAASLARELPLRAADAIHLASAREVASDDEDISFACWDRRLWEAASSSGGFRMVPAPDPEAT